jgi:hypothetical protein
VVQLYGDETAWHSIAMMLRSRRDYEHVELHSMGSFFYEQEMLNYEHKTETEVKSDLVISRSWQHCIYMHQLADQWSTIYIWLPSRALPSFDKFFWLCFLFLF